GRASHVVLPGDEIQRRAKHVGPGMECLRTAVRLRPPPPIMKPQPFSVGVFSCPIAPTPACSRGFLRKPADFGIQPMAPSRAAFLSLPAVFLSGLAPGNRAEVRKGRERHAYKSTGYTRTNQAVGLQHRPTKG